MDTFYTMILCISAEWASVIVDVIIGCAVAWVLAFEVPRKLNKERSLKDFYMQELQVIKTEFNDFSKNISIGSLSAGLIKETFKQLSIKLSDIQDSINHNLDCNINLTSQLLDMQKFVTDRAEINDQYENPNVDFEKDAVREIGWLQERFNKNMLSAIAAINKASAK